MKRLGIYAFYDPDGIADEGDLMYLEAVAAELDDLVIVVNGALSEKSRQAFENSTDHIILRENRGFDGGAFREVLLERLPRAIWEDVEELVLFNNTVFGPVYPLASIFERFSKQPADFWGMTPWHGSELSFPEHVQSYFLVFKKAVFQSVAFWAFWQSLRMDFTDVSYLIATYEVQFTPYLVAHGFRYAVLSDENIYTDPLRVLRDGVPVIKKKTLREHVGIDYETMFRILEQTNPKIKRAMIAYMERQKVDRRTARWTNERILEAVRPYSRIYFYGRLVRSYYVLSKLPDKERFLVESDEYDHDGEQGGIHLLHLSELPAHAEDDAIMVVFLGKRNTAFVRERLKSIFSHIIFLCDGMPLDDAQTNM